MLTVISTAGPPKAGRSGDGLYQAQQKNGDVQRDLPEKYNVPFLSRENRKRVVRSASRAMMVAPNGLQNVTDG